MLELAGAPLLGVIDEPLLRRLGQDGDAQLGARRKRELHRLARRIELLAAHQEAIGVGRALHREQVRRQRRQARGHVLLGVGIVGQDLEDLIELLIGEIGAVAQELDLHLAHEEDEVVEVDAAVEVDGAIELQERRLVLLLRHQAVGSGHERARVVGIELARLAVAIERRRILVLRVMGVALVQVIHRVGRLLAGQPIELAHRIGRAVRVQIGHAQ